MDAIATFIKRFNLHPIDPLTRLEATEERLALFESTVNTNLPTGYRSFLYRYGRMGFDGLVTFELREKTPFGTLGSIDYFLGFSTTEDDIIHQTMQTYSGRIPDETIPIGIDACGNLILLGIEGSHRDRVYYWDHEHLELRPDDVSKIYHELEEAGYDVYSLNQHAAIYYWERLPATQLTKPFGFGNVYLVETSFDMFLQSLSLLHPAG